MRVRTFGTLWLSAVLTVVGLIVASCGGSSTGPDGEDFELVGTYRLVLGYSSPEKIFDIVSLDSVSVVRCPSIGALVVTREDPSLEGTYETLGQCAIEGVSERSWPFIGFEGTIENGRRVGDTVEFDGVREPISVIGDTLPVVECQFNGSVEEVTEGGGDEDPIFGLAGTATCAEGVPRTGPPFRVPPGSQWTWVAFKQ